VHPIAFQIGSFPIHWYGVMIALAFLAGLWTAVRRARRQNISAEQISDVTLWLMAGSIIGARIVYVATYWHEEFAGRPVQNIFAIWQGGLVFYGGLIGAAAAGFIYGFWKKLPVWKIADVLAPSIALGSFFGRIGCLLNGCCYGTVCNLPWGIRFPNGSYAWEHQRGQNLIGENDPALPVHPTEIYDALLNLSLYIFLAWLFRRKKFDGQILATYLICYAITRSITETFRGDYTELHYHLGLTPAQWISVPILISGLLLATVLSQRARSR
jgi:phosphatidylglycerol:prolipoprotein diacylglycerol transferase